MTFPGPVDDDGPGCTHVPLVDIQLSPVPRLGSLDRILPVPGAAGNAGPLQLPTALSADAEKERYES